MRKPSLESVIVWVLALASALCFALPLATLARTY